MWGRIRGVNPHLASHFPNFPQMLSPTYKQRNEDFRKLFSKLPEAERLIVGESWCPCTLDPTLSSQLCPPDPLTWVLAMPAG